MVFAITVFVASVIATLYRRDPGGPLFWPIWFLALFAAGAVLSIILSVAAACSDLARRKWGTPIWIPAVVVGAFSMTPFVVAGKILPAGISAVAGAGVFSLYWALVSSGWFLPKKIFGVIREFFPRPRSRPPIRGLDS